MRQTISPGLGLNVLSLTSTGNIVVVLGADSPLGPLVVSDLRSKGYIVIASVSTVEAIPELERIGKGYVKALVLDPYDVSCAIIYVHLVACSDTFHWCRSLRRQHRSCDLYNRHCR